MSSGQSSAPALAPVHGENEQPQVTYTEFHPRWYRPQISTYWWLGKWPYVKFILRELTSVAVAWTVAVMLMQIFALTHSGAFYDGFEALMALPVMILVNFIAFAFLVFHSVTWFNLAPKAMAVRVGGKRVHGILISGPQYLAWIAVSAIVLFILATRT
ncbi:MAG: fumarate reductase subunit C [Acidobacteria bacterium]|nr:fumarate reductase subunit C [Acidobacteriota bacterium]